MIEKLPPIEYLLRVRSDLELILRREPKASDIVHDACAAALPHVRTAIGYLDATMPCGTERNTWRLRNIKEMFDLSEDDAGYFDHDVAEWLDGRSGDIIDDARMSRDILRLIRDDLREAQTANDSVRSELDGALRHICGAIGQLIPPFRPFRRRG
jgi:hypothetical protein